jgi:hypothetical protein
VGAEPGCTACGVGGSKRGSTDAEEAEAVDPDNLALATPELSSTFDIEFLNFSVLRRVSEGET